MKTLQILCVLMLGMFASNAKHEETLTIELQKDFNFSYIITNENLLHLNNKFGNIKVKFGSSKLLKIEARIIVRAINNDLANKILSQIKVESAKTGNSIKAETVFNNMAHYSNRDQHVKYEINYEITMPTNMGLDLINKFGDVYLPSFSAPLTLNLDFCKLFADDVSNANSSMKISYGQATVGKLTGTDIRSNFTNFKAEELKNVMFVDNYSELKAKILNDVEGKFNYSHGVFDQVKEGLKLKLNYSNNIKMINIDEQIKNLEIISNFSNVILPLSKNFNGAFSIKTVNGSFMIDPAFLINYQKNTEQDNSKNNKSYSPSNTYEGKIGKKPSSNVKIIIISNYGDVKIND